MCRQQQQGAHDEDDCAPAGQRVAVAARLQALRHRLKQLLRLLPPSHATVSVSHNPLSRHMGLGMPYLVHGQPLKWTYSLTRCWA